MAQPTTRREYTSSSTATYNQAGATITVESQIAATSLTIEGEASDPSLQFESIAGNITSRPPTVASVVWSPPEWPTVGEAGLAQRTPDLAAIIQEVVDGPGWASGKALVVIIKAGVGDRTAESFEGDPAGAPLLHVEYTGGP